VKRFQVIIEQPAAEDLDHYYQRAVAAGAGVNAARWYNRIVEAILSLEEGAEWRGPVPEQDEFSEKLYQVVFERRYRIIYTVIEDRVHVLCVRGQGLRELGSADIEWPAPKDEGG
jgi:plasmid stabilization system protein ParE